MILLLDITCLYYSQPLEKKSLNTTKNINNSELISISVRPRSISWSRSISTSRPFRISSGTTYVPLSNGISSNVFTVQNMTKIKDINYIGTIFIGTPKKRMTVIFDTAMNTSWFSSIECQACDPNTEKYNLSASSTGLDLNEKMNLSKPYLPGFVKGNLSFENFAMNYDEGRSKFYKTEPFGIKMNKMKFVNVINEESYGERISDGVIGLNINNDYYSSLIQILSYLQYINYPTFSFYLLEDKNISRIYFGDITCNYYLKDLFRDNIKYCYIKSNALFWECLPSYGIKLINNNSLLNNTEGMKDTIFKTNCSIIFDSSISYIIIPENDFITILDFINLEHNCTINENGQIICQCLTQNEFDNDKIEIYFDLNNKFEINLKNIIEYKITNNSENIAILDINIGTSFNDSWVLGYGAFKGNLISFSIDDRKISFIQNIKEIIDNEKLYKSEWFNKSNIKAFLIVLIIGLVIFVIIALIFFFAFYEIVCWSRF